MSNEAESAARYEPTAAQARPRPIDEPVARYSGYESYRYESDSGGMTSLSGWLLILGGLWTFFEGLALLAKKSYFTSLSGYSSAAHNYALHWNLTGWGWAYLIFGIVMFAAGVCVLLNQEWARWTGVVLGCIGAVGSFVFLPFYPFWSIIVIAINVFIVWALATARRRQDFPA
ncbi:MAG TPA: hypothetical protein VEV61_14705 [Streptosporangiaceae bacterium]|nr:hypothetical protein [Streptosporangiaceae bacterium]